MPVTKILIANRGEIAVRVIRTCREMGIPTVAVYSEADRGALHVRMATQAYCLGQAPARESYLVIEKILDACKKSGADAVHPGYGFLSENAEAARAFEAAGITFIGPSPDCIASMGSKTAARGVALAAGCPVVPGVQETMADEELLEAAGKIGFPVMLKAALGGGGKGMRLVTRPDEFASALARARGEALSSFGDDSVYVEKAIVQPRHIEIQIFSDMHGNHVYLHERECSVQRRHQKVIEEAPSPYVTPEMRRAMGEAALKVARAVNYVGAGTVEFLADADRNFYFLEMNTRLQVEHPVTEWITGLDLVKWQILVARGERLPLAQGQIPLNGWAVECRVYAEDPDRNFMPSPGRITFLRTPGGRNVRDDGGVYQGAEVPIFYDPLISKLSTWGPTRMEAIERMREALGEYRIGGIRHNLAFHEALMEHGPFREGALHTGILDKPFWKRKGQGPDLRFAVAAAMLHELETEPPWVGQPPSSGDGRPEAGKPGDASTAWGRRGIPLKRRLILGQDQLEVDLLHQEGGTTLVWEGQPQVIDILEPEPGCYSILLDGRSVEVRLDRAKSADPEAHAYRALLPDGPYEFALADPRRVLVASPMPGKVLKLLVRAGDPVREGQALLVLEAMGTQSELGTAMAGTVQTVHVQEGATVETGAPLVAVVAPEA